MCFLQYLEERHYIDPSDRYEYGRYFNTASEFEEETLIFLEMLKIFFPAGLTLPVIEDKDFKEYAQKYDYLKNATNLNDDDR